MKQREIREEGITWQCVQAFGGVESLSDKKIDDLTSDRGKVEVICTPSGGAQTIRLSLPSSWLESMSDDELRTAIRAGSIGR
jgi:hypothetical protein